MITRLSTMSDKEKKDYLKYYKDVMLSGITGFKILEPTTEFNDLGLRFPIEYLRQLGKNVVFLPLEIMAEYADIIIKSSIDYNDKDFIYHQIKDLDCNIENVYQNINATSIGNMAYILLNSQYEKAKEICEKQLNIIYEKEIQELSNSMNYNV